MFRYIALVWNVIDEQQSRTADSLVRLSSALRS